MLVVVPVSSTKTSEVRSSPCCAARQISRARATSSRSCSVAKIVLFFVPQPEPPDGAPDTRVTDVEAALRQLAANLNQRQLASLRQALGDPLRFIPQLRTPVAPHRTSRIAPRPLVAAIPITRR